MSINRTAPTKLPQKSSYVLLSRTQAEHLGKRRKTFLATAIFWGALGDIQSPRKRLVRGWVKFITAIA